MGIPSSQFSIGADCGPQIRFRPFRVELVRIGRVFARVLEELLSSSDGSPALLFRAERLHAFWTKGKWPLFELPLVKVVQDSGGGSGQRVNRDNIGLVKPKPDGDVYLPPGCGKLRDWRRGGHGALTLI